MTESASETLKSDAIALIEEHERLFESGDLDADMINFADDIAVLALDAPVLEGKSAVRDFYVNLMEMGTWSFRHNYSGADVAGDCVFLYGVAHGTHTPANGDAQFSFANNFLIVVRKIERNLRVWRAAFMPGASD